MEQGHSILDFINNTTQIRVLDLSCSFIQHFQIFLLVKVMSLMLYLKIGSRNLRHLNSYKKLLQETFINKLQDKKNVDSVLFPVNL